jgi:mRNA interferase RelE/StbE
MAKRYEVRIKSNVEKTLDGYDAALRSRIIEKFSQIAEDPRGQDSKKLDEGIYRVRVGDYRIIYEVHDKERTAVVLRIGHRSEVYR